jgi:hypothetical protein
MVDVPVGKGGVQKKPISISEYNMFMKQINIWPTILFRRK